MFPDATGWRSSCPLAVVGVALAIGLPLACAPRVQEVEPTVEDATSAEQELPADRPFLIVLGNAQDGGAPQAGDKNVDRWLPLDNHRYPTCLALVDPIAGTRYLFEATPAFPQQLAELDRRVPDQGMPGLDGVFVTHAHVGHYAGLLFLGFEVIGARKVPVYAAPRMRSFLESNGPWSQLVAYENVELHTLTLDQPLRLSERLAVTAFRVPHREEFSEVVGYRIDGPERSALFIPDIDSWQDWQEWGVRIEDRLAEVDLAFVDGTFWANGEVAGRDMSGFPHPRIRDSLERFAPLDTKEREKVHFIHLNHTNPVADPSSAEAQEVLRQGSSVARRGDVFPL